MPLVEFEPTIPASERAKTGHALDGEATVISDTQGLSELHRVETNFLPLPANELRFIGPQACSPDAAPTEPSRL
jgi:hypothetical protein